MISVLFVNNIPFNPYYGGIERATDILVKSLIEMGYKICYLSSSCPEIAMLEYQYPVNQYVLPSRKLHSKENKEFYRKLLSEQQIDVVVNQRGLLAEGNFYIDNILPNIKIISCFHSKPFGYWEICGDMLLVYRKTLIEKFKCLLKLITYPVSLHLLKKVEYQKAKHQLEYAIKKSHRAVFLSDSYIDIVLDRCQIANSKMISIPNPNTYSKDEICQVAKEKIILFVGRLSFWDKRPMTMLHIWQNIQNFFPDWHLYIIGHGELEKELKKYVVNKHINRVHFEGKQNPLSYYQKASVLCMTSAYEGFPMVLTEAMQNGVVPIAFSSFGAAFDIINNCNGVLIPPFSIEKYIEGLVALMKDDIYRLNMAKNAQEYVHRFDLENVVEKWETVFNEIIEA